MRFRAPPAGRLVPAVLLAALLGAGCAHAPAQAASAGRAPPARAGGPEHPQRVLVTGSRLPRPVGRDGLPVTDFPVRIYWRRDVARAGDPDLARALRKLDVDSR